MENKIRFNNEEIKWNYRIVPCLECPIYPLKYQWKNDVDIRNDMCYTSGCTWYKLKSKEMSDALFFMKEHWYCDDCDTYFSKDLNSECPECGQDCHF